MKVSYNVEMDVNELNATINGVKDLLAFAANQQKQQRQHEDLLTEFSRRLKILEEYKREQERPRPAQHR